MDSFVADIRSRSRSTDSSVSSDRLRYRYHIRHVEGKTYPQIVRVPHGGSTPTWCSTRPLGLRPDFFRLVYAEPSQDESLIAFAVDTTGDEHAALRFLGTGTGELLDDVIEHVAPTLAWSQDGSHVAYVLLDALSRPHQVWLHRIGTDPTSDRLLLDEPDARYNVRVQPCADGSWAFLERASRITADAVALRLTGGLDVVDLLPREPGVERRYELAGSGSVARLFCITNDEATESRLVSAPGDPATWSDPDRYEVEMPGSSRRLVRAHAVGDHLVVESRTGSYPSLTVLPLQDNRCTPADLYEILPRFEGGTIALVPSSRPGARTILVAEQSRIHPREVHEVDLASREATLVERDMYAGHDVAAYRTRRVWVTADDGVEIPVTLTHRADTPLDGTAPALLYGYGAYETSFEPIFRPSILTLVDQGVVHAYAHVRGGGELGHGWWLQGRLGSKERTFDDYVAVAEHLGRTVVDPRRIATRGMSAGGLLQAAVLTRRPDLWCGVIAEVPWVDVVNSMCDEGIPLTVRERDEWGDPRDPEQLAWMLAYSPYENLPPAGGRPPVLVTGAVHDTRVLVKEPAKWVAALRASDPAWARECLFRVELGAGSHSGPSGGAAVRYEAELISPPAHDPRGGRMETVGHWINGRVAPTAPDARFGDVFNPATGKVARQVELASAERVREVVAAAAAAFPEWRDTSLARRTSIVFRFRELLNERKEELAAIITEEHGKVLSDALGEVGRGQEVVEFACGIPHLLKGGYTENASTGVDVHSLRQPIGVSAIISPFNFPAMVPMWFFPVAIATGNTVVLKPSEKDPSAANWLAELWKEAGLPDGVFNVVHGDKEAVDTILESPEVASVSFVGSTPIAKYVYENGTAAGKRVQALGGAKNHMLVLPDADLDLAADAAVNAGYGAAGERCMAISVVVAVDSIADELVAKIAERASGLRVGDGTRETDMGPLITGEHRDKVAGYVDAGDEAGAQLVLDGRTVEPDAEGDGFFLNPTLFDNVTPDMSIYTDEIFGPVLAVVRVPGYDEGIDLINSNPYGNGTAIFTNDGDTHAYGDEGVHFFTRGKVITTRWLDPSHAGLQLGFPTNG